MVTQERLRELFKYDPETGLFTRRINQGKGLAGNLAGTVPMNSGYLRIRVDGQYYQAHRLAWLYMTGSFPPEFIDHRNGVRSDNRLANLRCATNAENNWNAKGKGSSTGIKGVTWDASRGKYQVRICKGSKTRHLGRFDCKEAAAEAYATAAKQLHGDYAKVA